MTNKQKETMQKFMCALEQIAYFVYPTLNIESTIARTITTEGFDYYTRQNEYYINGVADGKAITIRSIGTIVGGKGCQIEIMEDGVVRYFPFFGINWTYLTAIPK